MMRRAVRAVCLAGLALAKSYSLADPMPVRIGVILSLTGPGAATGLPDRDGLVLAAKRINAAGGIAGRPLQLSIADDKSVASEAAQRTEALIAEGVRLLIGPNLLANTLAAGKVAARRGVPMVALTGIDMAQEAERDCVMHVLPLQALNAQALLAYAKNALGATRVAVLHDSGYGRVIMDNLRVHAAAFDISFPVVEEFRIDATDLAGKAQRVKASQPQAVFVVGLSPRPFQAMRDVGLLVPVIAAVASATYPTIKAMGPAANNVRFAEFLVGEDPLPYQDEFIAAFQKEYGHLPKTFEAASWDALAAAAAALERAGPDAGPQRLCSELRKPYKGVLGEFDFSAPDHTGLSLRNFVYSKVSVGNFARLPYRNRDKQAAALPGAAAREAQRAGH
jgi:branched-chain amino acid transport system substrate-binding protein